MPLEKRLEAAKIAELEKLDAELHQEIEDQQNDHEMHL